MQKQNRQQAAIAPDWSGDTVVCIGGGPSLTPEDVQAVMGKARVIAINDAYQLAPWADMLYGCDHKWWNWHNGARHFLGERWTQDQAAADEYGLNWIEGRRGDGLSTDPTYIHTGHNSGYQAINMAYHRGACRVILLGYDMKFGADGSAHWFGDHPDKIRSTYSMFIRSMETIATQDRIEVINCSRDTALTCFPRVDLEDVLWI